MATSEEYKIILRVEGEAQVAKLSEEIRKEEKALADLAARLRAIGATQDQIVQGTAVYAQSIANLNQQLQAAQRQIGEAGGRMQGMAQGLVQLGYAVDDAQYGIKGLANNIQPLLMAFGVTGGLAGIIGIVVTATAVLSDKWGKLMDLMGTGKVKTQADEMKALAEQVEKTVEQEAKLDEYKRQKAAGEKVKALPKSQQEAINAGQAAIVEAGGGDRLAAGIRGVRESGVGGLNPNADGYEEYIKQKDRADNAAKYAAAESTNGVTYTPEAIRKRAEEKMAELRKKNQKASQDQAIDLIERASNGDQNAYKALVGMIRSNPGAFPPNALREIQKGTPEGQHNLKLQSIVGDMGQDIAKEQAGFKKEVEWKQARMEEGEKSIQRTQDNRRRDIDFKNSKMDEVNRDISRTNARQQEVQDYFNSIKEGPDAETQAFLDKQKEKAVRKAEKAHAERQADFSNLGGGDAVGNVAVGMMMQGGNAQQVYKALRDRLTGSVGAQEADKMARSATQQGVNSLFSMQYDQMMQAMGPRQIHSLRSFKDAVSTSDPMSDMMRKQWEASKKASDTLLNIEEIMRNRTFPTVVN